MILPDVTPIVDLVGRLEPASISETPELLIAKVEMDSHAFTLWCGGELPVGIEAIEVFDQSDTAVTADDFSDDARLSCRVKVCKTATPTEKRFLTLRGLEEFLASQGPRGEKVIVSAQQRCFFASASCAFVPWNEPSPELVTTQFTPNPRRFTRDLSGIAVVPSTIIDCIAVRYPDDQSDTAWLVWMRHAMRKISLALATEVQRTDHGSLELLFRSKRGTSVELDEVNSAVAMREFEVANELATWVYLEGQDVETRHILAANAIADDWPVGQPWNVGIGSVGRLALEVAKSGYALHLSDIGNEALRSLGDLRKSLYEEIPRMLQQARDLSNGLWRDFAIAIAVVIARVTQNDTAVVLGRPLDSWLLFAVAIYIFASAFAGVFVSVRFRLLDSRSREKWIDRVFRFIGEHDRKELATKPYGDATRIFYIATWLVGVLYALLIFMLVTLAFNLGSSPSGKSSGPTSMGKSHQAAKKTSQP